ncbi:MAG: hypothetical protein H0V06_03350 [Gemmatimonadetes bacterium]|nr:hypothetical protein [Gemmatimonadota bacterium]
MTGALAFLALRSAHNWAAARLSKVFQPRYLVALLAVGAYFWFLIIRPDVQPGDRPGAPVGDAASALLMLASLALVLPVTWWWLGRADRSALAFSPAETQWLFPAPVHRRALILWKLARAQLPLVFNVLLFTLFFRRGGGTVEAAARQAVGFWLLVTTLHLHRLGAALTRAGATEHGRVGIRRFGPGFVLVLAGLLLLGGGAARAWPGWSPEEGGRSLIAALTTTFGSPLPALVLAPFHAVLAPIFAAGLAEWLRAAAVSLLILLLHLAWVVRTDTAFEAAAAKASARQAEQLNAHREGQPAVRGSRVGRVWFLLAPTGHPAVALLWKNTAAITTGLRPVLIFPLVVFVGMPAFLLATEIFPRLTFGSFVAVAALVVLAYSLLFGPLLVRNDLRSDLLHAATLRAYPLRGETLVLVEIASSAAVLATVQFAALLLAFVATLGEPTLLGGPGMRTALLLAGLLLLPAVSLLAVTVQNSIAMLFPDWVQLGPQVRGGIESMGQGILVMAGSVLLLALLLLIPLVAGGAVAGIGFRLGVAWALPPGAGLAAALITMEVWFVVMWLGRVWDQTDRIAPE